MLHGEDFSCAHSSFSSPPLHCSRSNHPRPVNSKIGVYRNQSRTTRLFRPIIVSFIAVEGGIIYLRGGAFCCFRNGAVLGCHSLRVCLKWLEVNQLRREGVALNRIASLEVIWITGSVTSSRVYTPKHGHFHLQTPNKEKAGTFLQPAPRRIKENINFIFYFFNIIFQMTLNYIWL